VTSIYLEPDTSGPAGERIAGVQRLLLAHADEETILQAWRAVLSRPELAAAPAARRAGALADAGIAFLTLFERTGNRDLVNGAIELLSGAAADAPPTSPQLPLALSYLGVAFGLRFEFTDDQADLHRAVERCNQALSKVPADDWRAGVYVYNAAVQCERLYRRRGTPGLLDATVELLAEAVRITKPGAPVAAAAAKRLAELLIERGHPGDAEQAERWRDRAAQRDTKPLSS
jgi:hypothetical protein